MFCSRINSVCNLAAEKPKSIFADRVFRGWISISPANDNNWHFICVALHAWVWLKAAAHHITFTHTCSQPFTSTTYKKRKAALLAAAVKVEEMSAREREWDYRLGYIMCAHLRTPFFQLAPAGVRVYFLYCIRAFIWIDEYGMKRKALD